MSETGDRRRLIEAAFPLQRVSEDSVHEKNVRHGHISTLHIWPARRPLAASRAVVLATLLPDPGDEAGRRRVLERMAGHEVEIRDRDGAVFDKVRRDGIFHWGSENEEELERFRGEIREAFPGRAPRVLDPFAGGGAIPLEALRLGCEVEAADLNPVAWFILRCTLHYPRLVAGKRLPLPEDGPARSAARSAAPPAGAEGGDPADEPEEAQPEGSPGLWSSEGMPEPKPFPDHLREWGHRVLDGARRELAARYPTYADFEPVRRKGRRGTEETEEIPYEPRPRQLLEPDREGAVRASLSRLNAEFGSDYLRDERNPRWVEKPTVAYLWARTVECAGCRAEMPLLKTRWLCRKPGKRVLLTMTPGEDGAGVGFGVDPAVPAGEGTAAARREHDRRLGAGTMTRRGVTCPGCGAISTMRDLRAAGKGGRLGERLTAVVVNGQRGKEYRLPTEGEVEASRVTEEELEGLYADIPHGLPTEPTPPEGALGMRIPRYGFDTWRKLFTNRQLLAIGTLIRGIRRCAGEMEETYDAHWREALWMSLAGALSKFTDYSSSTCVWHNSGEKLGHTYARFALPIMWDYCEVSPLSAKTGGFLASVEWVARVQERLGETGAVRRPSVHLRSAAGAIPGQFDLICTDPPYYDAIPYSDLMDFFHLWLRRTLHGVSEETDRALADPLGPKWDDESADGELIDDANRFEGSRKASKKNYEEGMARCFGRFRDALRDDGRFVVVFASKDPNAWETLVFAVIEAGFVVTASWPIATERAARQRSLSSAALASSIWLVCRKRPALARAGWDNRVLSEMRTNITQRLRDFWDAGLRGPDFVWAATGPALEAFSRHPFVRKVHSAADEKMTVSEFLRQVRRMVVGFAVGRLLRLPRKPGAAADPESGADDAGAYGEEADTEALDDPTTYYLLHRNDFGLEPAPAGACILYALSCGLSDTDLAGRLDLLSRKQGGAADEDEEDDENDDEGERPSEETGPSSGDKARLKSWRRRRKDVGLPAADGTPPPLIDCVHRAMRLWKTGERAQVDGYLNERGLPHNELFRRVLQALIELAEKGSEERATLEKLQRHEPSGTVTAASPAARPSTLFP